MIENNATVTGRDGPHSARTSLTDRTGEQALVAAAQAGMTDAIDELLVGHKAALYRAARRFTRSHEDAEDLVQDAMLRAFINVRKFRQESQFATWLIAILNNAALSMKRRGRKTNFISLDSRDGEPADLGRWDVPDVRRNPEQESIQRELLAILYTVLQRQSPAHQIMLERCVFDEARIAETASSLGLTIGSAKSNLFRARRRIAESFVRRGFVKRRKPETMRAQSRHLENAENL